MTERSHHKAAELPEKLKPNYAGIAAIITALATALGGHAYDRNSNIEESQNMHKGVFSHFESQMKIMEFRVKRIEEDYKELHGYVHSSRPRAAHGDAVPPVAAGWLRPPPPPISESPPLLPQRSKADIFNEIKQKAQKGEVYQAPGGYPY